MAIIENELRDLLRDRGDDLPVAVTSAPRRLDDVRGRIVRRRRQRTAAGGVVATLAVAVGALGWAGAFDKVLAHRNDSLPAVPSDLMPEYVNGGRLLKADWASGGVGTEVRVVVPVPDAALTIRTACTGEAEQPQIDVSIAGRQISEGSCWTGTTWTTSELADLGLVAGRSVEVTATVEPAAACGGDCRTGSAVRLALGLYVAVPRSQYPFPPRPTKVSAARTLLDLRRAGRQVVGIEARTQGANSRASFQVQARADRSLTIEAGSPGIVTVTVNGRDRQSIEFWDYEATERHVDLSPETLKAMGLSNVDGQVLTIDVVASDFSDPTWLVWADAEATDVAVPDPRP